MSLRRFLTALLAVLAVLVAACTGASGGALGTPAPDSSASPTTTTTVAPTTSTTEQGAALRAQIDELIAATERARELPFLTPPNVTLVTPEELAERVRGLIEDELDEDDIARDEALLTALGLIDVDLDLANLYTDLYTEQVAGFYDGETEELVVPMSEGELSALQRVTLVHELVHSLTDQHFDFHPTFESLDDEERYDEVSAFQALIEGDATFTELRYMLEELSVGEQLSIVTESLGMDSSVFNSSPRYLQDALIYPYTEGNAFVTALHESGGFAAIDDAYANPPMSTEQVLQPEMFLDSEQPVDIELPVLTLDGYELSEESVWGSLGFRLMLADRLTGTVAATAAEGWGGDQYAVYWDGVDVVLVVRYVGDTEVDAEELFGALDDFMTAGMAVGEGVEGAAGRSYVGDDFGLIHRDGSTITWVVASDPAVGEAAAAALADL